MNPKRANIWEYILWLVGLLGLAALLFESSKYTLLFEGLFLLISIAHIAGIKKQLLSWTVLISVYVVAGAVLAVGLRKANILDYLLIYKGFIYFILLTFVAGKETIAARGFLRFFRFFLVLICAKYLLSKVFFGVNRPILFFENNYELMFLSLLFYLYYILKGKVDYWIQIMFAASVLLSGSKSGILVLLLLFAVVYRKQIISKLPIIVPSLIILTWIIIAVLESRMGGSLDFQKIDRVRFLTIFLEEIKDWKLIDYLLGTDRITALNSESCRKLSYFKTLFSYKNDGSCYSVIYHSYLMRMLFDHGLLVSFLFILGYFRMLKTSGFLFKEALVFLGIVLINGLSVSSFNSIYFALGLGIVFLVKKKK